MEIIKKNELDELLEGDIVEGYVLIQSCSILNQKNGGQYISGVLQAKGQVSFKVWSNTLPSSAYVTILKNIDSYKNVICEISGKVNKYGGVTSLILDTITISKEKGISELDFLEEVYDENKWFKKLIVVLSKNCSEKALNLFVDIIDPIKDRFTSEFAAIYHHDNCKAGLLAHTTKVVRMATLLKMYPNILSKVSPDVLFLSCALHDVGKIYEYSNGILSNEGKKLSHNTMGIMLMMENETLIKETMGNDFFYTLLAVIQQHHGEYGERPRTLASYIVNKLDELDATFTSLDSIISNTKDEQVQYQGYKLI